MDSIVSSPDVSSGKTASFASGILSSLNALLGSSADAGMFASLLAEEQGSTSVPSSQTNTVAQTNPSQSDTSANASQDGGTGVLGALGSLINGLHHILDKLNKQNGDKDNSGVTNASTGSGNTTVSSGATPLSNAGAQTQRSGTTSSETSSTNSSSDPSTDGTDATTDSHLTSLLSDLTALMKLMEKKLEAAQAGASGTTTSADADNSDSATSAADPLTQLLTLMQSIQKELTALAGNGLTGTSDAPTASTSSLSPTAAALQDLLQLQKNIKGLLASFESATGSDSEGSGSTSSSSGTDNTPVTTATDNLLKTSTPVLPTKTSLAEDDSVFSSFAGTFSNYTNPQSLPVFSSTNADADISSGSSGTSSNTSGQDNDSLSSFDKGSSNLNSLGASNSLAVSGVGDSGKSLDPYAFASQLSAARATNGGATGLPDAVEQVILQINRGVKDGDDQMSIQLHPAELGKINVKLDISQDGQVRGTIVADNPSTLNALHKDVRSLERALQEAGLRADPGSLHFSMSGQSNNASNQSANNSSSGNASSDDESSEGTSNAPGDLSTASDEIYYVTPGRVNLKV